MTVSHALALQAAMFFTLGVVTFWAAGFPGARHQFVVIAVRTAITFCVVALASGIASIWAGVR